MFPQLLVEPNSRGHLKLSYTSRSLQIGYSLVVSCWMPGGEDLSEVGAGQQMPLQRSKLATPPWYQLPSCRWRESLSLTLSKQESTSTAEGGVPLDFSDNIFDSFVR